MNFIENRELFKFSSSVKRVANQRETNFTRTQRKMYLYKAFGIYIESEILVPQFTETENQLADVVIKFGDVKHLIPAGSGTDRATQVSEWEICFYWEQLGWFLVRNGNEIIVEQYPHTDVQLLSIPLIGIAFAALLQQRGMFVLHASAVAVDNQAVAFLGWKGAGKSTTAATLYKRGHTMISDDIVAMDDSNIGAPLVVPGFPIFKLMPEAAETVLGDNPDDLLEICAGVEKRFRPSSDNFLQSSASLRAIYALDEGTHLRAELLKPQEAISTLIANTYLARYGNQLLQNSHAMTNLRQCSNIVNHIPVYRLERPKSFHLLKDLAELIESQCRTEMSAA